MGGVLRITGRPRTHRAGSALDARRGLLASVGFGSCFGVRGRLGNQERLGALGSGFTCSGIQQHSTPLYHTLAQFTVHPAPMPHPLAVESCSAGGLSSQGRLGSCSKGRFFAPVCCHRAVFPLWSFSMSKINSIDLNRQVDRWICTGACLCSNAP